MTFFTEIHSPVGTLTLTKTAAGLTRLLIDERPKSEWRRDACAFDEETRQLAEYFAGKRDTFDLALAPEGTPFRKRVWGELQKIPFGKTTTYGALARKLGNPNGSRSVGGANHHNPIAIVIPCHRVIGANGTLVGYASGLPRKKWLLDHELRA